MSFWFWDCLKSPGSEPLAVWLTAFATVLLVFGLLQTSTAIKKSARSAAFNLMQGRYNAPDMLSARSILARDYLNYKQKGAFWNLNAAPTGKVVHFLNQVGYLVDEKRIDFVDAMLAYSDHVILIGDKWNETLGADHRENRFAPFMRLHEKMKKSNCPVMFKTPLDNYYDDEFWKCEANLSAQCNSLE
jgi:hypothetical protein